LSKICFELGWIESACGCLLEAAATPLSAYWPAAQWFSSHGLMRHVKHSKTAPDAAMGLKTHSYHDAEMEIVFGEEIERRASDAKFILETATKHGVPVEMLWKPA